MDNNNQFMNQNNMYYPGYMGGMTYGQQPVQKPMMVNPLTPEEREALKVNNNFSLQVTPQEIAEAVCTHKYSDKGEFAVIPNGDGTCTCQICHQTINPDVVDEEYVKTATDMFSNVLETCKMIGIDMNPDLIRGYYQMIPFVRKAPALFKLSHQSYSKFGNLLPQNQQMGGPNYFGMMNMLANPAIPFGNQMYPGMQQGYPYGASPMPMMSPTQGMQMQATPGGVPNPFYQTQSQQQPVAAQPAPAMNPPQYSAPTTSDSNTVTVKETIKL